MQFWIPTLIGHCKNNLKGYGKLLDVDRVNWCKLECWNSIVALSEQVNPMQSAMRPTTPEEEYFMCYSDRISGGGPLDAIRQNIFVIEIIPARLHLIHVSTIRRFVRKRLFLLGI